MDHLLQHLINQVSHGDRIILVQSIKIHFSLMKKDYLHLNYLNKN